ncbi:MAG: deoxynucleoside kinase [Defluviitaleaceae bacterium]|nr:deoxynucleoside kinase [Defluviitaleaceae bacterium]
MKFFKNNYIISLEGIDGSGKTTQCKLLLDFLKKNNIKVRIIGRRFIFSTLISLFFSTDVIISDRYIHTLHIYLNHKGVKNKLVKKILNMFEKPKIVFHLDIDIKEAKKRIEKRGKRKEKYETTEGLRIFYNGYNKCFEKGNKVYKIYKINAKNKKQVIHKDISRITLNEIKKLKN